MDGQHFERETRDYGSGSEWYPARRLEMVDEGDRWFGRFNGRNDDVLRLA
jgi:hypothetical protein